MMILEVLIDLSTPLTMVVSIIYITVGLYMMRKRQSWHDGKSLTDRGIAGIIALAGLYILVQLVIGSNVHCCGTPPPRL